MLLQKSMHFHPSLESQHLANGGLRQSFGTVAFKGQCLKRNPRRVLPSGATCRAISSGMLRVISTGLRIAYVPGTRGTSR